MPLAKCPRCSNLFNKEAIVVCSDCRDAEEEDYLKVREILAGDPTLDANALAGKCEVDVDVVLRMLDAGTISTTEEGGSMATCGRCGRPAISATKKLCESCLQELDREIADQKRQTRLGAKKDIEIGGFGSVRDSIDSKRRS